MRGEHVNRRNERKRMKRSYYIHTVFINFNIATAIRYKFKKSNYDLFLKISFFSWIFFKFQSTSQEITHKPRIINTNENKLKF